MGKFRESSGKSEGRREMASVPQFAFGSFRFDARTGQLWRDGREVKLTSRAAAVLHMLAERASALQSALPVAFRTPGVPSTKIHRISKELSY